MIRTTFLLLFTAGAGIAGTVFTMDTTPLQSSAAGPFTLDFQFTDGSGAGDGNNTVTLSDFSFGGGSIDTTPSSSTGGVNVTTGPFAISLTDTSFYNDLQFGLTPGSSLGFTLDETANPDAGAPDTFTFAIFDGSGSEITTTNPNGFDSFIEADLPTNTSTTVTTLSPSAPGASVALNAPVRSAGSPTPEPTALVPMAALALALFCKRKLAVRR